MRVIMGQKEAQANAQILEMVGDIPDADAKPPENVLFVCKLNPATTAEDLEIIFSRFGAILTCEVIKDQKTGDSLQYAFIEFENEEDCIKAYFKMDNVLIDDRRIHVDFCQSLAKVKGVRHRKLSSEKESLADRFAPKSQTKGDGYEMVFDVEGGSRRAKRSRGGEREGERKGGEKRGGRAVGGRGRKGAGERRRKGTGERGRRRKYKDQDQEAGKGTDTTNIVIEIAPETDTDLVYIYHACHLFYHHFIVGSHYDFCFYHLCDCEYPFCLCTCPLISKDGCLDSLVARLN